MLLLIPERFNPACDTFILPFGTFPVLYSSWFGTGGLPSALVAIVSLGKLPF